MKIQKNKFVAITIAALLVLSMSASIILIPSASAHNPGWQIAMFAYIAVEPNNIGVGQTTNVYMWVDSPYAGAAQ